MNENLILSLQITALGMGLVFAAIILLSLMMSLLTRFTGSKDDASSSAPGSPKEPMSDSPEAVPVMDKNYKAQAAAIAVAIALAEKTQAQPISEPPTASVSAWQIGMRARQLYQKGNPLPTRRTR